MTNINHPWINGGDNSSKPTVEKLPNGHWLITADADTDADGSPRVGSIDPVTGQSCTSLGKANGWQGQGEYPDSEKIPFFVLPLNWQQITGEKVALGDFAKLTFKDRYIYAILADIGPKTIIGEASICAIEALGGNPWNKTKTRIISGLPFGVRYEIAPGSKILKESRTFEEIQQTGKKIFATNVKQTDPQKFVSMFKNNYAVVRQDVQKWFVPKFSDTATHNGCVAHQVTCLKLCNLPYPQLGTLESINVDYFVAWALRNHWTRIDDVTKLQAGDVCVSGSSMTNIDHVYCFVDYISPVSAHVYHNQVFGLGVRSLDGRGCGKWRFALRMPS